MWYHRPHTHMPWRLTSSSKSEILCGIIGNPKRERERWLMIRGLIDWQFKVSRLPAGNSPKLHYKNAISEKKGRHDNLSNRSRFHMRAVLNYIFKCIGPWIGRFHMRVVLHYIFKCSALWIGIHPMYIFIYIIIFIHTSPDSHNTTFQH